MGWSVDCPSKEFKERLRKQLLLSSPDNEPLLCMGEEGDGEKLSLPFAFGRKCFPKGHSPPETTFNFIGEPKLEQLEPIHRAYEELERNNSLVLNFPTGFGKTFCALFLASLTQKIVCVVYPLKTLEPQWSKSISKLTDARVWVNNRGGNPSPDTQVILTTPGKIHRLPETVRKRVGCLVVDEVHLFLTNLKYKNLLQIEPAYLIGLTATLEIEEKHLLEGMALMFGRAVRQEDSKNVTVVRLFTNISFPVKKKYDGREDWALLCKRVAEHEERNRMIATKIRETKGKILVLTLRIFHAQRLYSILKEEGEDVALLVHKDKDYPDARVLISTSKKSGTGFDDENFCSDYKGERFSILFLTFSLKKVLFLKQLMGRVFRSENPIIVEFVDDHYVIQSHARKRDLYYRERDYSVYLFNLPGLSASVDMASAS